MKKLIYILLAIIFNCNAQEQKIIVGLHNSDILKAVYNNFNINSKSSKWIVKDDSIIKKFYKSDQFILFTSIKFIKDSIYINNKRHAIIITQSKPENYDCHPCGPLMGIILLENVNNLWKIKYNKYLDLLGTWGEIPEPRIELMGQQKYSVSFETGITGQGYTSTKLILYEIQEDNVNKVLIINDFAEDNEGVCDKSLNNCWGYFSTYYFEKSSNDYFDLIINTSGKKLEKNNINSFKITRIYRYANGQYNLTIQKVF